MEEKGPNALEMAKEKEETHQESAEEKGRQALAVPVSYVGDMQFWHGCPAASFYNAELFYA